EGVTLERGPDDARRGDGVRLERGPDDVWRGHSRGETSVLSTAAVETRVQALLGARIEPMESPSLPPQREPSATITVHASDDVWAIEVHGDCPGRSDYALVRRGEGWLGCVDNQLLAAPALPIAGEPSSGALLETKLLPYALDRVLSIEQIRPNALDLGRYGG